MQRWSPKKKKKRSSPVSLHLFHHLWLKYATKREANQVRTFFFLEMLLEWQIFRPDERTLTQIARKILNLECATSKHAMRQIWRNAPRLATPGFRSVTKKVKLFWGCNSSFLSSLILQLSALVFIILWQFKLKVIDSKQQVNYYNIKWTTPA